MMHNYQRQNEGGQMNEMSEEVFFMVYSFAACVESITLF